MQPLRPLGDTGLKVSALTLGTSYLGNPPQHDGTAAPEALELAKCMIGGPFAAIDTSNNYAQGRSETVIGQALQETGLPDGHLIITKADADPQTGTFDRDRVWRSFEESTQRLGLDTIPLLHLHDPFHFVTRQEAFAHDGPVQGLLELKEQGLAQAIGIAAGETILMRQFIATGAFDAMLTHNRYTLIDSRAQDLLHEASERGMGIFNAAPFGGGLLAGAGSEYAYRQAPAALLSWLERAKGLCSTWGVELPAAALHFSLRNPLIHSTVVGVSKPARLQELQHLQEATIPDPFWDAIAALGSPPSTLND